MGDRAAIAMKLALHMITRLEDAIEIIDDSAGYGGALLMRTRDIHAKACERARPDPIQLARDIFRRQLNDPYGVFNDAHAIYANALGSAGLEEYRRLAEEAWDKLAPKGAARRQEISFESKHDTLEAALDWFLERDGDLDGRIALRAKDLSSQYLYVELISFCQAHGREKEALARAEEALWQFEDERPDERLIFLAARLLESAGRVGEAEAAVKHAFEKAPSLGYYARLKKLGGEPAGRAATAFLEARLGKRETHHFSAASDLLVRILTYEKDFASAWRIGKDHGASQQTIMALAEASETAHPGEVLDVYAREVEDLVRVGGNENYDIAADRVARMAKLRSAEAQRAYVAELRQRHKRKRNFMKLLA
jgi:tetratricopeptide (TPR) repeat protein